jgi:hypothetical protein
MKGMITRFRPRKIVDAGSDRSDSQRFFPIGQNVLYALDAAAVLNGYNYTARNG